jgi:pheromone shutdown-related protein TraB
VIELDAVSEFSSPVIDIDDGLRILGTAHISSDSVAAVRHHIENYRPDIVAVELCHVRYQALIEERRLDKEGLLKVIKEGKAPLVLLQTMLAAEQRKLGLDEGQQPGAELLAAIKLAEEYDIRVELVDRDIQTTLRRAWRKMKLREKFRVIFGMFGEDDDEDLPELEQMLQDKDMLSQMMDELRELAPGAGEVLIDERDAFLAGKIDALRGEEKILAVVGAGHLDGIQQRLNDGAAKQERLDELALEPKPRVIWKVVAWGMPLLVLGLLGYFLWNGDYESLFEVALVWLALNAGIAAFFCLLAGGHPLAIITAALASPITSLNPTLAAGWFAGYVQMKIAEPTGEDLHNFLSFKIEGEPTKIFFGLIDVSDLALFWKNRAGRVLMVTALTNLGSMLGAWFATAGILGSI